MSQANLDGRHPAQAAYSAIDRLAARIKQHESFRRLVYDDKTGKTIAPGTKVQGIATIGYGRNLATRGITQAEGDYLFANDLDICISETRRALPWIKDLDDARWSVIVEMAYNTGLPTLLKFKRTLASVQAGDYETAAVQMLESRWAEQVGKRARILAEIMRSGAWS